MAKDNIYESTSKRKTYV